MKIPLWLCYILAGYGSASNHTCFTAGWCINMSTRRGKFVMWCLDAKRAIADQPRNFKWRLGDVLAKAAARVRGDDTRIYGFYDCERGNDAAQIEERIRVALIMETRFLDGEDRGAINRIMEEVHELALAAKAVSWRNPELPK